jgi:hypothetical protein
LGIKERSILLRDAQWLKTGRWWLKSANWTLFGRLLQYPLDLGISGY